MFVFHGLVLNNARFKTDCHWNRISIVCRKHGHWSKHSNINTSLVLHFLPRRKTRIMVLKLELDMQSFKPTTSFGKWGIWGLVRLLHWWRSEALLVRATADVEPASSDFWVTTGNHPTLLKRPIAAISFTHILKPFTLIPLWHFPSLPMQYRHAPLQRNLSLLQRGSALEGGGPPKRQCASHRIRPHRLAFRLQPPAQVSAHNPRNSLIPSWNALVYCFLTLLVLMITFLSAPSYLPQNLET